MKFLFIESEKNQVNLSVSNQLVQSLEMLGHNVSISKTIEVETTKEKYDYIFIDLRENGAESIENVIEYIILFGVIKFLYKGLSLKAKQSELVWNGNLYIQPEDQHLNFSLKTIYNLTVSKNFTSLLSEMLEDLVSRVKKIKSEH